jgi:hypothetical protein
MRILVIVGTMLMLPLLAGVYLYASKPKATVGVIADPSDPHLVGRCIFESNASHNKHALLPMRERYDTDSWWCCA